MGRFSSSKKVNREMKLCSSLIGLTIVVAQDDRWGGSQDYYSLNYGFGSVGGSYGKNDGGLAAPVAGIDADLHHNGLYCWMCDERLDLGTETESSTDNAYLRCLQRGGLMKCRGEQRTCMFEERRRHGIIYSVCTGCKQTDACVAGWRRNQRFTLPFMNFGDMSLRNLPTATSNLPGADGDQLPNHRPVYVDDECSTYQETRTEKAWRATAYDGTTSWGDLTNPAGTKGINNEVYPMGWVPLLTASATAGVRATDGKPFSTTGSDLQFTGHRVNLGLSYSKFAYDGSGTLQLNAQLSQWESTCRWCCHARPDTVCNIEMKTINSSPFATKCGNSMGTKRDATINITNPSAISKAPHPMAAILAKLKTRITSTVTGDVGLDDGNQFGYWELLTNTDTDSVTAEINSATTNNLATPEDNRCSLSNAQWSTNADSAIVTANVGNYPQGIHNKFRFFQPFNIAQSHADFYNPNVGTCAGGTAAGADCALGT